MTLKLAYIRNMKPRMSFIVAIYRAFDDTALTKFTNVSVADILANTAPARQGKIVMSEL